MKDNTEMEYLKNVKLYLQSNLTDKDLQELANKCNSINNFCKGDGAGLLGGCLTDMLISKFFESKLPEYKEHRKGESDMKICNTQLSLKKINGKSTIALDWSKNKNNNNKEYFTNDMLIIVQKTEQWWKKKPKEKINNNIKYDDIITSGIYLVDKNYCKNNIKLSSNNKTDSLIDSQSLYCMIKNSINNNLYIEIPKSNKSIPFNILNAFLE